MKSKRQRRIQIFFCLTILTFILTLVGLNPWHWKLPRLISKSVPTRLTRPYGMVPVAFKAFLQACRDSRIHPNRIGQTIGDFPLSFGYHKKDGVLRVGKERIDYTAAVDLGANDLDRAGINRFLHNLTKQGFACWYREKGKWKGGEHIHAIYASLPMKPELRGQVRLFLRERQVRRIRCLPWERRVARQLRVKRG